MDARKQTSRCINNVTIRPVFNGTVSFLNHLSRCPQAISRDAKMYRFQIIVNYDNKY